METSYTNWQNNCYKDLYYIEICTLVYKIPSPDHEFIKEIDSLLFGYLWNQKPDKIKRSIIIQDFNKGGLGMLDLQCFIQSLKLTWMTRLLKSTSSSWIDSCEQSVSNLQNY